MDEAKLNLRRLSVYATGEHSCAYLPQRTARTLFVDPREPLSNTVYGNLMEQGFRRSGDYIYKPNCPGCDACRSLRIPVYDFHHSRRHRRCIRRNSEITVHAAPPRFSREHFRLYQRYVRERHEGSQMDDLSAEQYFDFLTAHWCDTIFYEFRDAGDLVAVAVTDTLPGSLSAVYTYYAPELAQRSLGMLAILWLIQEARSAGVPYLHLGYWIEESAKMRYKSDFRPHEVLIGGQWRRFD